MITANEAVALRPRRLAHGNFWVGDLQRSLAFYRDVCGLIQVFDEPGIGAVFLSNGNSHHDLALMQAMDADRIGREGQVQIPRGVGARAGLNHLGFEMETEADLVAAYQRARDAGVKMRTVNHQISHSVYLHDPDHHYLEFYADTAEGWREIYRRSENELLTQDWNPVGAEPDPLPRYDPSPDIDHLGSASLHPLRTSRATLLVSDLQRAVTFYTTVAGMSLLRLDADARLAVLAGAVGQPCIGLFESGGAPGLHHFGFEMKDEAELEQGLSRLRDAAIPMVAQIDRPDKRSFVLSDPDGTHIEFFVTRPGAEADRFAPPPGMSAAFAF